MKVFLPRGRIGYDVLVGCAQRSDTGCAVCGLAKTLPVRHLACEEYVGGPTPAKQRAPLVYRRYYKCGYLALKAADVHQEGLC